MAIRNTLTAIAAYLAAQAAGPVVPTAYGGATERLFSSGRSMTQTNNHAPGQIPSAGRRALLAAAIAVLLIGTDAAGIVLAQYTSRPAAASPDRLRAPIGHRQPRTQDLPPKVLDQEGGRSEADKQLDRALSGICRGC